MAQVTNFFLGANSGSGFQNLFLEILDVNDTFDLMILKGGPGVGKNTFMREIGRTIEAAGADVEYLWCSGDPDSLDGVVIPSIRCGVCDGTSPHVMEPRFPAAVDRYVDLGRFYDISAAKAQAEEVKRHTHDYKEAYIRAYRCLNSARQVELDTLAEIGKTVDCQRMLRRMAGIIARELRGHGSGSGKITKRFLGSITHKGAIWRFDSVDTLCPRVYEFADRYETAGGLLEIIQAEAVRRNYDVIACMAPENITRMEHLLIPELGLAFVTSRPGMEYVGKPCRRIRLDALAHPENKARLRFRRRMADVLREEGVAALQEAKAAHDRLESVYNPYVDFDGVRAQAALEAGRLLSWMQ